MKIVRMTAENFKRLVAVEITPEGNTVLITGKNGAGKSSVLDAIVSVLCGKKYHPKKPIRDGEDHAEATIETENWIIKRTFTASGGGQLTVLNKDGMKGTSPQALLDKIVGQIAFDPMLFIRMGDTVAGEREQLATVMRLAKLDFSDIDAEATSLKEQRSDVRKMKEHYEHEAGRITVPDGTPEKEVSVSELAAELQKATEFNANQAKVQDKVVSLRGSVAEFERTIKIQEQELEDLKQELEANKAEKKMIAEALALTEQLIEPLTDTSEITERMGEVEAVNDDVRRKRHKAQYLANAETEADKWRDLGQEMKALDAERALRLSNAKMPIEGMSVTEEGVIIDGIPLSQVNDAKKLEVGMAIAMAENPELRVILMKGNDLDEDSLAMVSKMAADKDFMVWIERIEGEGGIIIEDGSVKK